MSDGGGGGHKRRGHEEEHEEHENHERWLVSYADMMTLLMVLFIVMFAISQVDQKKFMALKTGLSAGFGAPIAMLSGADALLDAGSKITPESVNLAGVAGNKNPDPAQVAASKAASAADLKRTAELVNATSKDAVKSEAESLEQAEAQLRKALAAAGLAKGASFRFDQRGLIVSIATDKVLFGSGSATLAPTGRRILDALAPTLIKLPNQLSIDGHTNSVPIHTALFTDNLALSCSRAEGVERHLYSAQHLPLTRMSTTCFGDTRPLYPASDPRALSLNRRVEIVVVARVENSAGRALAELGNAAPIDATSRGSSSGTDSTGTDSTGTDSTTASPTASPSSLPTPTHNLLGPDPTPSASVHVTKRPSTKATKRPSAKVTTAPRSG